MPFYIHISALAYLDPVLETIEKEAITSTALAEKATLVKFSLDKPQIAYLFYPDFDTEAYPSLQSSIQVNLNTLTTTGRDYSTTDNPPVLHRKEIFVAPDHPTTLPSPGSPSKKKLWDCSMTRVASAFATTGSSACKNAMGLSMATPSPAQ